MQSGKTIIETIIEWYEEAKKNNLIAICHLETLAYGPPINIDALTTLGTCYFNGFAVDQDYKKAHEMYEQSAQAGCCIAKFNLGCLFQEGFGVAKTLQTAIYWYFEAAKGKTEYANKAIQQLEILANAPHNNPHAQTSLGVCYYFGYGVTQNYTKAFDYYSKAAEQNYDLAMYNLGILFEQGLGVDQNPITAESWYKKSIQYCTAETKSINQSEERLKLITPEKKLEFSTRKYLGKKWPELFEEAKKGDKGAVDALEVLASGASFDRNALTTLGTSYYSGYGVTQDYKKAREIYEKASQAGCDIATSSLGDMFQHGVGVKLDIKKAIDYYLEAIKHITPATATHNRAKEELAKLESFIIYLQRQAKNQNLPELKLPENYKANLSSVKKTSESNFDDQVIIDFMHPEFFSQISLTLAKKWNSAREKPCHVLRGVDLLAKTEQLNVLKNKDANRIRIYVVGHSWVSYNDLEDDNNKKIHVNKIAESLAHFIKDQNVVINLVSCCAGKGKDSSNKDSFGAKLHAELFKLTQRDIPVVARTSLVTMFTTEQRKATFKLSRLDDFKSNYDAILNQPEYKQTLPKQNFYLNKQPGSKVVFRLDSNKQQLCRDGYQEKLITHWKQIAVEALKKAKMQTGIKKQKKLLTSWLTLLSSDQFEEKVYQMMKHELVDTKSPLRKRGLVSRLFGPAFDIVKIVSDVVEKGQGLFKDSSQALALVIA